MSFWKALQRSTVWKMRPSITGNTSQTCSGGTVAFPRKIGSISNTVTTWFIFREILKIAGCIFSSAGSWIVLVQRRRFVHSAHVTKHRAITDWLFQNLFRTRVQQRKLINDTLGIELFEKRRFDAFVNFMFTLGVVASVTGPVMLLYFLRSQNGYIQNATAMGCTSAFALVCATATNAKRHEVIAVTAA